MIIHLTYQCVYPNSPEEPTFEERDVERAGPLTHEDIQELERLIAEEKTTDDVPKVTITGCQPIKG